MLYSQVEMRSALLVNALLLTTAAFAQQESGVTLRTDTRLVEVEITVRSAKGKPGEDLKQSDFTITDNGKPRSFTIFSVNRAEQGATSTAPLLQIPARTKLPPNVFTNQGRPAPSFERHSTVILLDGVNGWFESFVSGSKGIQGLMDKLPPDERIAVYVISRNEGLLQLIDYTTNRELVRQTMFAFAPRAMNPAPPFMDPSPDGHGMMESGPPPPSAARESPRERGYMLQRASEQVRFSMTALAERLRNLPGRKNIFWVTEGFPPRQMREMNQPAWERTIAALNDANVAVNTVDTDGLGGPPRYWGPGGILSMQQIAESTGGQAFFHRNDLDAAIAEGVVASRSSYTLGFYLTEMDGRYHELKVHVNRPGLELNHRQGYLAQTEAMHDLAGRKTELESALLNPLDLTGVGMTVSLEVKPDTLVVHLKLNPESLTLTQEAGGWSGRVEELFLERNEAGLQVGSISQIAKFQVADRRGVTLSHSIRRARGATKLFIVIRDSASGRTGSLHIPLK